MNISNLQKARYDYKPKLPRNTRSSPEEVGITLGEPTESAADQADLKQIFQKTYGKPKARLERGSNPDISKKICVGVVLSGGQAPGGHNVIAGLFDAIKGANKESELIGFLGGPSGILDNDAIELTSGFIDQYRNTGGFDIIGSGRTKIETDEQMEKVIQVCTERKLNALIVIGGDDSNTNAALLAEFFKKREKDIQVIGVPKTIDGDLKNESIEISFGFDTATKTYSELIGNIGRDGISAKKYWHFIKMMGRSASHICLECALQTQPNIAIISEEIESKQKTLGEIVDDIVSIIVARSENNENYGIALVPEGLIEFIPEMKLLISELSDLLTAKSEYYSTLHTYEDQSEWINKNLSKDSSYVFSSLPNTIQRQLLLDRDPHGNVQVSRIETEKLLIEMVEDRLAEKKAEGSFKGVFSALNHFFGYEGRCAFPSNFDADYCYSLGYTAFYLVSFGLTGYISSITNLSKPSSEWAAGGVPLTMMMNMEHRHGKKKPVIKKALVELEGKPFTTYTSRRDKWALTTSFKYPGAIQYFGPSSVCNAPTETLIIEHS